MLNEANDCNIVTGSGKTLAFGIPMIHAILEWKKSSAKPADDDTKATAQVESLYLPESANVCESTTQEDEDVMDEEEEGEGSIELDQSDEEQDDSERLGCVQVVENAVFDFEAGENSAGGRVQPLLGLVLTPTRELAVQVKHHIDAISKFTGESLKFTDRLFYN